VINNYKVIWVNGCFDVLHRGHIELLKYAKSLGDFLFVGIDSDAKVRRSKGIARPINTHEDRQEILRALSCVDDVFIFNTKSMLEWLIKTIHPDIMVIGDDYVNKPVVGSAFAKELIFFKRLPNYASSNIIKEL
jgi:D-beta-D-heptose 7-phosphate kinase/D-beta-D-heptose 1-phosphate adenosyltransferase